MDDGKPENRMDAILSTFLLFEPTTFSHCSGE